jgi:glycosyltransferase involved in cell wall biosynthesis
MTATGRPTKTCDLSVVVICGAGDGGAVAECDTELIATLTSLGLDAEIVYVDNGSGDDTVFKLRQRLAVPAAIPRKLVVLGRHYGMSAALAAGAEHAAGRFIATLDAGLTVDPVNLGGLIAEIEKGYDLVTGWRQRQHLGWFPRWRSTVVNSITSTVTGLRLRDYGSSFRVFRRDVIEDVKGHGDFYAFTPVFAHAAGARIGELPVTYRPHHYTGREYTPRSIWTSFLDLVTVWFLSRHSLRPMHVFGTLGFAFIGLSVVTLAAAFVNKSARSISLIMTPLPVLAGVLLAVGILTILLGLTAEMVIRTYLEAQGRPLFRVREVVTARGEAS